MNNKVSFECLKPHERDFFVSRISCGYFFIIYNDNILKYIYPNKDILFKANEICYNTYNECLHKTIGDNEVLKLLEQEYGWNYDNEKFLSEFYDTSKQIKIDLFKNMYNPIKKQSLKQKILELEKEFNRLYNIKNSFYDMTAEGIANNEKWSFIVNNCIFDSKNKKITFNIQKTQNIINLILGSALSDKILRDIAKNEPWSSLWYASRGRCIFQGKYSDYSNEQLRLISWSRMYDSIRKSYKPPSEDVIEDDDILDGWMAQNAIEREREKEVSLMPKED